MTTAKRGPGRPRKEPASDSPAEKRPVGRPRKDGLDPDVADMIGGINRQPPKPKVTQERLRDLTEIHYGVTQTWLAQAFHLDKKTVTRKLAALEPMRNEGSMKLYALHQAAPYLIKPKVDVQEYLMTMNPKDLPTVLQESYWGAMIKRQKWEENAKHLFRAEEVLDTFGSLAMMIKSRVQLWVEDLDRIHGLTPEMRKQVTQEADSLLESIHELMVEAPSRSRTMSSVVEQDTQGGEEEIIDV